ncbi:MAG: FtsX-like permease family protein [Butyricicoccaceae bacterium]
MGRMTAWKKNKRREIRRSLGRYLAMLVIVALGVGFFSGLKVTRSAIVQTGDHYISRYDMFDYRLLSTLGLTDEDTEAIRQLDSVQNAEGSVSADFIAVQPNGDEVVLKAHSITQTINQVDLTAGRMPEQADECVVDRRAYSEEDLGKTIRVSEHNDSDTLDYFAYREYKIVGLAESVLYLNNERGTSKLAGGSVHAYIFLPKDGFATDYNTEMYLTLRDRGSIFTQEYEDAAEAAEPEISAALELRAQLRYDDIIDEINEKIQEGQDEYDEGYQTYQTEKADAEQELADALEELQAAKAEIDSGERKLSDGQKQLDQGRQSYQNGLKQYQDGKAQYQTAKQQTEIQLAAAQDKLDSNRAQVTNGLNQIEQSGVLEQYEQLKAAIPQLEAGLQAIETARGQQAELEEQLVQVQSGMRQIEDSGVLERYEQLTAAIPQLEDAIAQAEAAREQEAELKEQLAQVQRGIQQIEDSGVLEQYEQLTATISQLEDSIAQAEAAREQEAALQEQLAQAQAALEQAEQDGDTEQAAQLTEQIAELEAALAQIPSEEQVQELRDQLAQAQAGAEKIEQSGVLEQYEQLTDAETQLEEALAQIPSEAQVQALKDQLAQAQDGVQRIEDSGVLEQYEQLTDAETQLKEALAQFPSEEQEQELRDQLAQAQDGLRQIEDSGVLEQYVQLTAAQGQIRDGQIELDSKRAQAQRELSSAAAELQSSKQQLDRAKRQLDSSQAELDSGRAELENAKQQYEDGVRRYEDGRAEADQSFAEAEQELADALEKLEDARRERDDIAQPETYALDRMTNTGYVCFENDSAIVEGIAKVFPVFFFLVAALVCMTTMTRMVDEQRTQIGTFKALGYSDWDIMKKYIGYSGSAAVIGAVLGFFGGCKLFPYALWKAYNMMYDFAEIEFVFDAKLAVLSLAVALLCSVGATVAACRAELARMPAELMRPKAPKPGKRVLLERITPVWSRMSFLHKVTMRNIFRYKKRLIMMVLGISGCTALVLTGFGVKDSIGNLAEDQYGSIMKFDYEITFADPQGEQARAQFSEDTGSLLTDCVFLCKDSMDVVCKKGIQQVNIVASDQPQMTELIDFHRDGAQVSYPNDGEVLINEKLASLTGASVGDSITIRTDETHSVEVKVSGIFENYVYNYIFMTEATYESVAGENCEYQSAYASSAGGDLHDTAAKLVKDYGAAAVTVTQDTKSMVANMMLSLNYIVWLVIACAGVLAFVVLFNLSNINLTERVREIATLKVLGFYPGETGAYVFRENIVLTALGALVGLPLGVALHRFVMDQIQVDMVSFQVRILPQSFLLALGVTFLFALMVELVMRRKLNRIDMAESLKSVE